ncbi:MAG TPA: aminotransferase class I/II-fold pyridoxal phosphate-dependent enzyme [Solirubrobacteraceae bacterium]|nr:aminotransferase class I/II-fold pyridoxal phosphate-dependent enzyme [Solirubrobacteraceae bacterium]
MEHYTIRARTSVGLVEEVELAVGEGRLAPGERLPSVRALAAQAGLSPSTVAAALAELRRRGLVVTDGRRGTRVATPAPAGTAAALVAVPEGARDLSRGNPDPALLPDLRAALARCRPPVSMYGEAPVLPALAQLTVEQLGAVRADQELCVVSGALEGVELLLQSSLRPGDRVAVENPGYAALFDLLRANGLRLEAVPLDGHGMLPEALEGALRAGAAAAVMTPRGQNPTGALLDDARARELSDVLARFPRVLAIEDDHLGMLGEEPRHSSLAACERWAIATSVSKALGPDLRVALLRGDPHTVARVQRRQQCGPGWVSHVLQSLVATLWGSRSVQRQLSRAQVRYRERREGLLEQLHARGLAAHGASGLNVWVPVAEESAVVAGLLSRGWAVAPGALYRLGSSPPAVRITTSTLAAGEAAAVAEDLAAILLAGASRSG